MLQSVGKARVALGRCLGVGAGGSDHKAIRARQKPDFMHHRHRDDHHRRHRDCIGPGFNLDLPTAAFHEQKLDVIWMRMGANCPIIGPGPIPDRFNVNEVKLHLRKGVTIEIVARNRLLC